MQSVVYKTTLRELDDGAGCAAEIKAWATANKIDRLISAAAATVAAELAKNVVAHGGGGKLWATFDGAAIELCASNKRFGGGEELAEKLRLANANKKTAPRGLGTIVRLARFVSAAEDELGRITVTALVLDRPLSRPSRRPF